MKQIKQLIKRFLRWCRRWLWEEAIKEQEPDKLYKLKLTDVQHEYMVLQYRGQHINIHRNEYELWKRMGRKDKRAMAKRFEVQEEKGLIRFEEIEGKLICIKNRDYNPK